MLAQVFQGSSKIRYQDSDNGLICLLVSLPLEERAVSAWLDHEQCGFEAEA
jgi:hypothetical protein